MAIKQANNQRRNKRPNGDRHAVERAFLQLGLVLAEIADSSDRHRNKEALQKENDDATSDSQDKGAPT